MMNNNFRSAFVLSKRNVLEYFNDWMMPMTPAQLDKIIQVAKKLDIEDYLKRPAVDVLYDIACKLSILEVDIVSPSLILDKIDEYLKGN